MADKADIKIYPLEIMSISKLKEATYNPRVKLKPGMPEYEALKKSILKHGFADPAVVNKRTGFTIVGGHQRIAVAKELGYTEVPCSIVDLDVVEEKELNIALNKITGMFDDVMLADLISDIQSSGGELEATGFTPPEADELFNKIHDKNIKEDDFDVEEELKKPTIAQQGDIFMLGDHRVICGDSTKEETYDRLMEGKEVNMVLTDPPYNVNVEETAGKIKNDNMDSESFYKFLLSAFLNMIRVMANDASIYVFHADTEGLNFRHAFDEAGFYLSGCCIWKKNALVLGRSPYQWQHEPCLYGWKKSGKHNWYSDRKQTTIWEYDRPKASKDHPTMKPVALMAYPIQNSCMSNCIVLDPFLGSGSTLVACEQTNRICYGIELDEKFVDVIVRRYIEQAGDNDKVFVIRDGKKIAYKDLVPDGVE